MAMGIGITLLASVLPARRPTRVPPVAAVREGATLAPAELARRSYAAGLITTAASLVSIGPGAFAGGSGAVLVLLLVGGALGLFGGHRAARAALHQAAHSGRRLAGAPDRRRRRRGRVDERRAESRPDGLDRRHADDRAHARDRRRRARGKPDSSHARSGHRADPRGLCRRP